MLTLSPCCSLARSAHAVLMEELERQPAEFRAAFTKAQTMRGRAGGESPGATGKPPAASGKPGLTGEMEAIAKQLETAKDRQSKTLAELERAERMVEDPSQMAEVLARAGLTPEALAAAEASGDPDVMRNLAARMVEATVGPLSELGSADDAALERAAELGKDAERAKAAMAGAEPAADGGGGGGGGGDGGGGGGDRKAKAKAKAKARAKAKAKAAGAGGQSDAGGGGIADPQLAAMAAQLEERKRQLAAAEAEVARQVEVARKQAESVAHARTELAQAEREKKEQGSKVDAAAVGANEELRREAARRGDVLSAAEAHKERGDRALRAGDLGAARGFYGEAVELAEEGRLAEYHFARLRANRCACLLRMGLPAEALADAEAAARLDPNWAKAAYRLGCVQHALGRRAAAAEALRRAVALATEAEAAEIEARLATVQRELDAEAAEAAARKAEAAKLAAAGDWEAARAAYSALLEAAWQEDTDPDPALLANRAACALRLGQLEACVADCDAALGDGDDEDDEGDGEGDAGGEARLPARLRWKLLLRRAEALRGLGRPDEAARSLDQAVALPHDADAAAVLARVRDSLHACAV